MWGPSLKIPVSAKGFPGSSASLQAVELGETLMGGGGGVVWRCHHGP